MRRVLAAVAAIAACAGVTWGQDAAEGEMEEDRFGEISLDDGVREDARGIYLRGALLINGYADADFETMGVSGDAEFDPGGGGSFAVGYHQSRENKGFRIEGELTYEETEGELASGAVTADLEIASLAVNGYFDLHLHERWTWYIGGGVGGSAIEASNDSGTAENDGTAFIQLMSGFEFVVAGPFTTYGGLRLRGYDVIELEDDVGDQLDLEGFGSLGLELGVMLRF